jgi:4-amino-4-deoxy-L-arabinose transferase-like glycosyltransferase
MSLNLTLSHDKKIFFLIFSICLIIFVFTNDGHRYTIDEDSAQLQTIRIVTQTPHHLYVQGESTRNFEYPELFPVPEKRICQNAILCSATSVGYSLTEVPFVLLNYHLQIISNDNIWTNEDFNDPHYVWWRNSIDSNFTFLELFFGPIYSALSVGVFFLITRTFEIREKNAVIVSFLFGLSTIIWAYSQTSLNSVPLIFLVLSGFLFFRGFQIHNSVRRLALCGVCLGFAFLVRMDAILFIIPLFIFFSYQLIGKQRKIISSIAFIFPLASSYGIYLLLEWIRFGTNAAQKINSSGATITSIGSGSTPIQEGMIGLLISPGAGILVFAPILFTVFFSFPDFFKKYKAECILFLSFITLFLLYYSTQTFWHGLVGWGARYTLPIIAFMLIPLGISLNERQNKKIICILLVLGGMGVFFNIVYVIQDVSWFVWGQFGEPGGLFGLGAGDDSIPLRIHPTVLWTFENSQLTYAIFTITERFHADIFLLKVLGSTIFTLSIITSLSILSFLLIRLMKKKNFEKTV